MAQKTIPDLQESSSIDSNSIFIFDSGVQTFKILAPNVAAGIQRLLSVPIVAATKAELVSALATCSSNGGGIVQITTGFSINSAITIPAHTKVIGARGAVILSITTGGNFTLSDGSLLEDVYVTSSLNDSSNIVNVSGNYGIIRGCKFSPTGGNLVTCINITGNSNKIHNCVFTGVVGQANTHGINYAAGGNDNSDLDSVFLS
jgi:hypothetical protein